MKHRKAYELPVILVALACLLAASAPAQQGPKKPDPELKKVTAVVDQAWAEVKKFKEAGGKPGDENHPARKSAAVLWQYREQHPGTPAATRATVAALNLLSDANQFDEAIAKAKTLPLDDPIWERTISPFRNAAKSNGNPGVFFDTANSLLARSKNKNVRASVRWEIAYAHWEQGKLEDAKAAFQSLIEEAPDSRDAERAKGNIYEITHLNVGQPAPLFEAKTLDDTRISLANLRGKVVLLNFWATW